MKRRLLSVVMSAALAVSLLTGCAYVADPGADYLGNLNLSRYGLTPDSITKTFSSNFSDVYNGVQKLSVDIPNVEEATDFILSHGDYLDGLSQTNLDYKLSKNGATLEEYKQFLADQVREITPGEKFVIRDSVEALQTKFDELGFTVPALDSIEFIKTTMMEEPGAGAYTHANEIYISENWLEAVHDNEERYREAFDDTIAHEVFHVLTRNDRNFKENMYRLIGFTLDSSEPDFSPEVRERILANPDVESYDAHATFTINGEPTDGVIVSYFDGDYKDGRVMLDSVKTGVVPVDKPDRIVPIEEIPDFYDVVGHNTDYVIAAEEVLADNFSYAMTYGKDADYANPELIEGMLEYLSTGKTTERVTGILEEVAEAQGLSVEELAQEVIKGLWGNGTDRVEALEGAGYDAGAVQKEVNEMMGD